MVLKKMNHTETMVRYSSGGFDGPDNISIQQKSKELRLGEVKGGQNRWFNHKALITLG